MGCIGTPSGTKTNRTTGSLTSAYIGTNESSSNASSFDFGNFSAGSSALMIVFFLGRGDTLRDVTSISIGGSNGTLVLLNDASGLDYAAFAYRQVSSGNNNVTVTMAGTTGTNTAVSVAVYTLTGNVSDTPYWYEYINDSGGLVSIVSQAHQAAPQSVTFFTFQSYGATDITSITWTAGTETVDLADDEIGTTNRHRTYGRYINATDVAVNRTTTIDWTTNSQHGLISASWI